MGTLADLTREDVVRAFAEAKVRFARADADLKNFRFPSPPAAADFDRWKELSGIWDQRDEELQAAREDLRDFDRGQLTVAG
ncbi:MAG: hypothetical protein JOZ32_00785 [Bryobacterales bacterium]|nr:hypothetical protein [Bryobacterales bacterium]